MRKGLLLEALPPLSGFDLAFSDSGTLTLDHRDIGVMPLHYQRARKLTKAEVRFRVGSRTLPQSSTPASRYASKGWAVSPSYELALSLEAPAAIGGEAARGFLFGGESKSRRAQAPGLLLSVFKTGSLPGIWPKRR